MMAVSEDLGAARREIERLSREVARLQQELDAAKQSAEGRGRAAGTQHESTDYTRVSHELRESEQRVRELFNLLPASISFTRKSDHVFLEVNRGFELGSGLRREDVIGRSARDLDLWANAEERDKLLRLLDTQGDIRNHEMR
ncbi:MAG TPA: PAS domain S-box protein [Candidatus Paceibacterota bacterium]|nr:PAS domain S-box protein [Verrucomicrobiota bacterium]HRY47673.1 PAS domain S-box protein [Candidatus Paceibacterota bacterium]HSA03124.1 PAS domain S-box protein [Candidatus Paceibacterota bacterium]